MLFELSGLIALLPLALVFLVIAVLSKLVGCGGAAKASGMSTKESLSVGLGMVPRLEVPMIIAVYGVGQGMIDNDMLSMVIFVGIMSSIFASFLFKRSVRYQRKGSSTGTKDQMDMDVMVSRRTNT